MLNRAAVDSGGMFLLCFGPVALLLNEVQEGIFEHCWLSRAIGSAGATYYVVYFTLHWSSVAVPASRTTIYPDRGRWWIVSFLAQCWISCMILPRDDRREAFLVKILPLVGCIYRWLCSFSTPLPRFSVDICPGSAAASCGVCYHLILTLWWWYAQFWAPSVLAKCYDVTSSRELLS